MFGDVKQLFQMLDNSGPIARTAPAPYPIVNCEAMSAKGLTCNSVINSNIVRHLRPLQEPGCRR